MTNPTAALDAVEQALQGIMDTRDDPGALPVIKAKYVTNALTHLAALRQHVADLVAFRQAHKPCVSRIEYLENKNKCLEALNSDLMSSLLNIKGLTVPPHIPAPHEYNGGQGA